MKNNTKNAVLIFIALFLIIVGVAGLVLPLLPGILFIIVGLLILSAYNVRFEYWLHGITKKYPPLHTIALDIQAFIERILGKHTDHDSR